MSNKRQSSVEWLEQELKKLPFVNVLEIFKQAKAMHEQEITNSYDDGYSDSDNGNIINKEYYNETFNSDEA